MDQKIWYLKRADLFAGLKEEELTELAGISEMFRCERKHLFYLPEQPSDMVYLVKEGRIRLTRLTAEGRELTLDILGPGEIFGELALAEEERRSHYAQALESSLVCTLSRDRFLDFLHRHEEMTYRLIKLISFRRRELEARYEDLAFKPVAERMVLTLLRLAKKQGTEQAGAEVRLPLTQKDLAYLIGATREAVAEELAGLKREKLVKTSYRAIILADLAGLKKRSARP